MPAQLLRAQPWWTTAACFAIGVSLVQFCTRSFLWFLPYNVAGVINETGLLAIAVVLGLAVYLIRRRRPSPPPVRLSLVVSGVLYLVLSSAALGWSPGQGIALGAHRYVLFSTPECEFAARFEQPPQEGRVKGVLNVDEVPGGPPLLYVALLGDVATATAFRAECLPRPVAQSQDAAAEQLARGIARWATENNVRIEAVSLLNDPRARIFRLDGSMGGSILPEQEGRPNRTLVGLRSYVGLRSVMTLYVFQPQADSLSSEAAAFLDGVQRR